MPSLQDIAMWVVDCVMDTLPRRTPDAPALARCKIISHRGEHDNKTIMENTVAAFDSAVQAGVWGIECDIRFTRDLVPVICHDPCGTRVFGVTTPNAQLNLSELREALPQIPTLEEVVAGFGNTTHLMLELKEEHWPQPQTQRDTLAATLAALTPAEDYHLLALNPDLFQRVEFAPANACLPVAELNFRRLSQIALDRGYAGLGGHYVLLGKRFYERHIAQGQRLGVGFPRSKNALFRELNSGNEWIFSNDAVHLQNVLNAHRGQP